MTGLHPIRLDLQSDAVRLIPEFEGGPYCLMVLTHGVGSSMDDLVPLAKVLAADVPGLAVVSLNAPDQFDGAASGRQWFSIKGVTEANRPERVAAAMSSFRARILAEAEALGLSTDRVIVGGFSQGAIMSLSLGAEAQEAWLAIVALSGRLAAPPKVQQTEQNALIIHGKEDRVMPIDVARLTVDWLKQTSWAIDFRVLPGLGHQIDPRVLDIVTGYVLTRARALAPRHAAS
jgi:phospholipase/carboxylesterase